MITRYGIRIALLFLAFLSLSFAATGTSFCKCTCFEYSKLIPLNDNKNSKTDEGKGKTRTCQDCNKQFCLGYNLPGCAKATEADVFTTCFQRDSTKDELIVFIFIFVTVGLLVYAAAKPALEKWQMARATRQSYVPVEDQEPPR